MIVHSVEIETVHVYYSVNVETSDGLDREFHVRDDGWALFIESRPAGNRERISFGTESTRKADADTALVALKEWAEKKFTR